jgi:predicted Zn-dependent peptidase
VGFPSLSYVDPRKFALLVLQQLFGGGMSSRLFQRIREQLGLAYSVFAFQDSYRDCGIFGLYMATDRRRAEQALVAAIGELARLRRGDLDEEEVAAAREQLKGHLVLGLEHTSNRMNRLARHEIYTQSYMSIPATLRCIDRVRRDDLVALASELLVAERVTAVAMGPLSKAFMRELDWSPLA